MGGHGDGTQIWHEGRACCQGGAFGQQLIKKDGIHFLGRVPHSNADGETLGLQEVWPMHVYLRYLWPELWVRLRHGWVVASTRSQGMPVSEAIEHNVEGRMIPRISQNCLRLGSANCWQAESLLREFWSAAPCDP